MRFLLYQGRSGQQLLTEHTPEAWNYLLKVRDEDDRCTVEQAREDGWVDGSEEYGPDAYLSVDDGGTIETIELTEIS